MTHWRRPASGQTRPHSMATSPTLAQLRRCRYSFEWGLTTDYGNTTTPCRTMTGTGAFSSAIGNLEPQTTYHYRAKADGDGDDYGEDMTFTTNTIITNPPTVTTGTASGDRLYFGDAQRHPHQHGHCLVGAGVLRIWTDNKLRLHYHATDLEQPRYVQLHPHRPDSGHQLPLSRQGRR